MKVGRAEKGVYDVWVGSSSEQIELTGKITLPQDRVISQMREVSA